MKTKKSDLLEAMQTVLQEYKDKTHWVSCYKCSLCILFYDDMKNEDKECGKCPMTTFKISFNFGCVQRKCHPYDFRSYNSEKNNIIDYQRYQAVMEFYEKVIEKVKLMTYKEINKAGSFKFLIDIDNEIAEKYQII
jgi:rubredoxin